MIDRNRVEIISDEIFRLMDLVLFSCIIINNIMGIIVVVNFLYRYQNLDIRMTGIIDNAIIFV